MTAEEIRGKIGFTQHEHGAHFVRLTGKIEFSAEQLISKDVLLQWPDVVIDGAKEDIREAILRHIYGWQQQEFYEALHEFMATHHPMNEPGDPWYGPSLGKAGLARERLLKAARYQEAERERK